jgi:hypothetical protein
MKPTWKPDSHKNIFQKKKKKKKMKYKNLKMTHQDRTADKTYGHLQIQLQRNELTKFAKKKKKRIEKKRKPTKTKKKKKGDKNKVPFPSCFSLKLK